MRGALPGVALVQTRRGMHQEPHERPVGFGQIERALKGAAGRGLVAERVPGDRLQQESLNQPGPPAHSDGAVHDRRARPGRRVRVVPGEPQRRGGDAHLPAVAVTLAESGQNLLGGLGLAGSRQGMHKPGAQRPGKRMRPGQPLSGPERGQRVGGPAAAQLKLAADVLPPHRRGRVGFRPEDTLGALYPGLRLVQPPLPAQRGSKGHGGEAREQIVGPAVALGQLDCLPAELLCPRKPPVEVDLRLVHQAHELEIGPPDPARQCDRLLQVRLGLVEPACPGFAVADFYQRQRAQLLAQVWPRRLRNLGRRQQPLRLVSPRREVAAPPGH